MFRHGTLRDERRRRSLLEEAATASDASAATKSRRAAKAAETYAEGAHSDFHARWSDFVPRRHRWMAAIFAAGLALIIALHAGYYFAVQSAIWASAPIQALEVDRADSLGGWFAAIVTFLSAVLSVFIYSVRRYRLDDYRGRYRLWLYSAGLSFAMSIDAMADLRGLMRLLAVEGSGWIGPLNGDLWWLCPVAFMFALCGVRMALDLRGCRTALASLLFAWASLASGVALRYIALPTSDSVRMIALSSCWLAGCWFLFFAHVAFARHVLLDAHGQLPVRAAKPKREKKTSPAPADGKPKSAAKPAEAPKRDDLTTRIDPPHNLLHRSAASAADSKTSSVGGTARPQSAASPAFSKTAAAAKPASVSSHTTSDYDDDEDDRRSHKMSRAERKKLRKQQRAGRYGDDE